MQPATRLIFFAGLCVLVSFLIYWQGLTGPLFFDDKPALTANELVQIDGTVFDEWRVAAFSSNSGLLRRPLSMLSFAANHALSGDFSPAGVKAFNVSIHLVIAGLLYLLFHAVLKNLRVVPDAINCRLLALTAAAIWLMHPLNVSTVLYAVQRMAQLSALFVVAGLLVFMRYRQRWAEVGARPGEVFAAGLWLLLLAVLAVLSKESGALLPWLIIVLEVCIFRGAWAGKPNKLLRSSGWILLILPVALVLTVLLVSPETLTAGYAGRQFTLEERLLTQARLLWRYLGWICLPNINDMGFQHDDIPLSTSLLFPVTTVVALGGWLVLLLACFLLRKNFPLLLLAVMFFLVGHSLESTVIPLEMVYEHRNYLPSTLVCLVLSSVLIIPASRSSRVSTWYPVLGGLAILCLLLFIRVQTWSDELTLSRTNVAQHPESSRSNYFYANALLRHYRRGDESDLDEREKVESLLLSRHYFERMYQTNNMDLAAVVMLFYLDSRHFTEMQSEVDWLAKIYDLLATSTFQPSDWNALTLLFELLGSAPGMASETWVIGYLDRLSERYPNRAQILRFRYQYQSARNAEPRQLLPILWQAHQLSPDSSWVYYALLREYARNDDVAGMYESARLLLLHDPERYHGGKVKSMFRLVEQLPGTTHD